MDWTTIKIAITFIIGGFIINWFKKSYRFDGYSSQSDELEKVGKDLEKELKRLKKEMAKLEKQLKEQEKANAEKEQ